MDVRAVKLVPRAQRHLPRPARVSEHTILVLDNFDMDVAQYSVTAPSAFTLRIYSYAIRVLKTNSEFLLRHAAVYDPRLSRQLESPRLLRRSCPLRQSLAADVRRGFAEVLRGVG